MATTVAAAEADLPRLIAEAEAGHEVVIMRDATPVVRLVAVEGRSKRRFGALKGLVKFDESF